MREKFSENREQVLGNILKDTESEIFVCLEKFWATAGEGKLSSEIKSQLVIVENALQRISTPEVFAYYRMVHPDKNKEKILSPLSDRITEFGKKVSRILSQDN